MLITLKGEFMGDYFKDESGVCLPLAHCLKVTGCMFYVNFREVNGKYVVYKIQKANSV